MISVIIFSVDSQRVAELQENIEKTIGFPHEVIVFDNRKEKSGLCAVYNRCAEQAAGEVLLFLHEDILFYSCGWGGILFDKATEQETGVIGFAGSSYKSRTESGWMSLRPFVHSHLTEKGVRIGMNDNKDDFCEVSVIDGLALAVRKSVWEKIRFDEAVFSGFHGYDLDFSFAVSLEYRNYVCTSIELEHFSRGSFNAAWWESCKCFHRKWADILPYSVKTLTAEEIEDTERKIERKTTYLLVKNRLDNKNYRRRRLLHLLRREPFNPHNIEFLFKYWVE